MNEDTPKTEAAPEVALPKVEKLSKAETTASTQPKPRGKYADTYNEMLKLKPGESLKVTTVTSALQAMNTLWCRLHRNKLTGFSFRRLDDNTLIVIRVVK